MDFWGQVDGAHGGSEDHPHSCTSLPLGSVPCTEAIWSIYCLASRQSGGRVALLSTIIGVMKTELWWTSCWTSLWYGKVRSWHTVIVLGSYDKLWWTSYWATLWFCTDHPHSWRGSYIRWKQSNHCCTLLFLAPASSCIRGVLHIWQLVSFIYGKLAHWAYPDMVHTMVCGTQGDQLLL